MSLISPTGPYDPQLDEEASIKIIGVGGIGSIVARYAAVLLASFKTEARLVLIDGDAFEMSNASRMLFGSHGNKATVVRGELIDQFSDTSLSIVAIEEFVKPDNIDKLIQEDDIIIMAVDNLATRKIINGHVSKLNSITLVSAGNDGVEPNEDPPQFGTYGNCQYYVRQNGEDLGPSLTTYHPEIENPTDKLPEESCTEAILSSPQLLAANLMAASAIINTLWLHLCGKMFYAELSFDISAAKMSPWPIPLKTAPQTVEFGAEMAIEESPDS